MCSCMCMPSKNCFLDTLTDVICIDSAKCWYILLSSTPIDLLWYMQESAFYIVQSSVHGPMAPVPVDKGVHSIQARTRVLHHLSPPPSNITALS